MRPLITERWTRAAGRLGLHAAACVLLLAGSAEGSLHSGRIGSVQGTRTAAAAGVISVGRVQGRGHISPFRGRRVTTAGVVTAVDTDGFYLQDPAGDGR